MPRAKICANLYPQEYTPVTTCTFVEEIFYHGYIIERVAELWVAGDNFIVDPHAVYLPLRELTPAQKITGYSART